MPGFESEQDVSIVIKGTAWQIVSPGTPVSFLFPGIVDVEIDGVVASPLLRVSGKIRAYIPAGNHRLVIRLASTAPGSNLKN